MSAAAFDIRGVIIRRKRDKLISRAFAVALILSLLLVAYVNLVVLP